MCVRLGLWNFLFRATVLAALLLHCRPVIICRLVARLVAICMFALTF